MQGDYTRRGEYNDSQYGTLHRDKSLPSTQSTVQTSFPYSPHSS